jgi:oxidase EvaA
MSDGNTNMSVRDELLSLIDSKLDGAEAVKLHEYVDLVLADKNSFYSSAELYSWIDGIRAASTVVLTPKDVSKLRNWTTDPETGEISHSSGEFFRIIGVEISNATREVSGWDQPFVFQKEMGVLGIIRTKFDGVYHYLLHAKAEPGNTLLFQISPTLQATYSNLKTAHGGAVPRFSEFFVGQDEDKADVAYKQWLAEDGGRFFLKSNLNMLVEVAQADLPPIPDDYRWFTLSQIKEFLLHDNYINPHVRSILCHI